jgi:rhodanese-related sulfurtransferase
LIKEENEQIIDLAVSGSSGYSVGSRAACTAQPLPSGDDAGGDELILGMFPKNTDGYADVAVEQLAELLENDDITVVNVHIPYEGEIPQTDLHIPFDEITDHLDEFPEGNAPIILYCRSGNMSTSAASELALLGYTNVMEVDGGMIAWEEAGYELLNRQAGSTTEPPTPTTEAAEPTAPPPTVAPTATPLTVLSANDVQRITVAEARALVDSGNALLYDTRSLAEYRTLHAAGALSFPDSEMTARYDELPGDTALIFYCT